MHRSGSRLVAVGLGLCLGLAGCFMGLNGYCGSIEEARKLLLSGDYAACERYCEREIRETYSGLDYRLLLTETLLATGQYAEALSNIEIALERSPWSIRAHLLAREVNLYNGKSGRAEEALREINSLLTGRSRWSAQNAGEITAVGKAALLAGADARRVLDLVFERAKKIDATARDPYLAIGQLALEKHDYALAAKTYREGIKQFPQDPDMHLGLALAYVPSDRKQMLQSIEEALKINPQHVPSHLLLADHLIDGEEYTVAEKHLADVLKVNPWQPQAWAYRAVLAHLTAKPREESRARAQALRHWSNNPAVDHLIGRKLSQKYRFTEGAAYQRSALKVDPAYLPAKIQLTQDLLRLGNEAEGWALADQVYRDDGYDVTAYNLINLRDQLAKFRTLTNDAFIVRMEAREAAIYGPQVLGLLQRAKQKLEARYGFQLQQPTTVEIFHRPNDFGVRTFGMPDNPGYLGVCFGPVITVNSPAGQAAHPANWQAVLWHEFCHAITLASSKNKMPRWLSEGISVYEERLENATWGQHMNPRYREMILGDDFVPPSQLSAAFLSPASELHLQFAYFESSLVVEFLVERFGLPSLRKILADLGRGIPINEALPKHTVAMNVFEADFTRYARDRARALAPALDWTKPDAAHAAEADAVWGAKRTNNYYALLREAGQHVRAKQWREAIPPLETLVRLYPGQTGPDSAYRQLAEAYRGLGETEKERKILTEWAACDADALEAFSRLMEIGAAARDWGVVLTNAERHLAVNPLLPQPHRLLAQAAEGMNRPEPAIAAYRALLELEPSDPAVVHYRLARLLFQQGDPAARRHVLQALEEAPRYRDALRLLLRIQSRDSTGRDPDPASPPARVASARAEELPVQKTGGPP